MHFHSVEYHNQFDLLDTRPQGTGIVKLSKCNIGYILGRLVHVVSGLDQNQQYRVELVVGYPSQLVEVYPTRLGTHQAKNTLK